VIPLTLKILICGGSSCKKKPKKHKALLRSLKDVATLEDVRCQDICHGPVVGVTLKGRIEWLERLDTRKSREALVKLATHGKLGKSLKKRRVKKRAGRLQ
jgi:hypothetical protein